MTVRFLGWRQIEGPSKSNAAHAPLPRSPKDGDGKGPLRAQWSDANSFGESDGFNIAKWRAECEAELHELEAGPVRKRFVKPVTKQIRLSPLDFSATFVQAAIDGSHMQRGHVSLIQAARESYDKERALRVRQMQTEVSKRTRRLAVEWRDNKEKHEESFAVSAQVSSRPDSVHTEETVRGRGGRRMRTAQALDRLRNDPSSAATSRATARSPRPRTPELRDGVEREEQHSPSDDFKELRHRIKHAVTIRLKQRRKHNIRISRRREEWKARILGLPDASREILKEGFNLYANRKRTEIAAVDLWKALAFVGLRGPTIRERRAIDKACKVSVMSLATECCSFERSLEVIKETGDDDDHSSPTRGFMIPDWMIGFEEFCGEVVINARHALKEIRQELHFNEFLKVVLEDNSCVFLDVSQFKKLATKLELDEALVGHAAEIMCEPRHAGMADRSTPSTGPEAQLGIVLDFETVHAMLLEIEEQHHHRRHKRELEIKVKTGLGHDVFWEYEGELVRLYDYFLLHDKSKCEYLSFNEVKQLLHHLGLEPYRPREGACIDKLLKECDADGSEAFTFDELLDLITRIRAHQRAVREAKLRREFGRYVKRQAAMGIKSHQEIHVAEGSLEIAFTEQTTQKGPAKDAVDVEKLPGLLSAVGLTGSTPRERDVVERIVRTCCTSTVSFGEFQDVCQRIRERLTSEEVEEQYVNAEALGVDRPMLYQYQWAFDHARHVAKDCSGGVARHDFPKVLQALLVQPPPDDEVEAVLSLVCRKKGTNEISFQMFLEFMNAIRTNSKNMISLDKPFTLKSIMETKLREILGFFPLSSDYIDQVAAADLPDLVAGFLCVRPEADLREELHPPIGNVRQLISYAQKKSSGRREIKQSTTTQSDLDQISRQRAHDVVMS